METTLSYMRRGVSAEGLKIKSTLAFWLSLLAPMSIVAMTFLVFFFRGDKLVKPDTDPWFMWVGNSFIITAQLLVPMFLALLTALVNGTEHASLGWKQLYVTPVPRWAVFVNKYLLQLGLVVLAFLTFLVSIVLGGYLLGLVRPDLGFQHYHHVASISQGVFRIFMGSLFVFALQFCISFRFKSIAMSIGLGILFTLAFLVAMRWEHIGYYPYSWPSYSAMAFYSKEVGLFVPQMWFSLVGSFLILGLGLWDSVRKQII